MFRKRRRRAFKVNDAYQLRLWDESTGRLVGPPLGKDFAPVLFGLLFHISGTLKTLTGAVLFLG